MITIYKKKTNGLQYYRPQFLSEIQAAIAPENMRREERGTNQDIILPEMMNY